MLAPVEGRASSRSDLSFGPLVETFDLTLNDGERSEALGPFLYGQQIGTTKTWGIPPLLSTTSDPETDSREIDLLYPGITYNRFGAEYRFHILQIISFSGGGLQSGETKDRFTLFPFYFQQRSADSNQNYTALFPLYGHLKNRLFRSEIDFALWPLYVKTIKHRGSGSVGADDLVPVGLPWAEVHRDEIATYNFAAPFFHLRYGDGLRGWQFWPVAGHERKVVTTRTNVWGDFESVPGHKKSFIAWPFCIWQTRDIGTTNISHFSAFLPFYASLRSPLRDSTSYLWPLGLTLTDDRGAQYRETDFLWQMFVCARGEGKTTTRVWPLFGHSHNDRIETDFYLWPLYKHRRAHSDAVERERTRLLLFLYSDTKTKNLLTEKDARRVDLWPLFSKTRDFDGNTRFQMLALGEPFFPHNKSVTRNWSPLWSLWRSENNPNTGASSQSLIWNLYRHQVNDDGSKRTSFLFGLFQHRKSTNGTSLRLLFVPVKKERDATTAVKVDSSRKIAHPHGGAEPSH
jgi:hypothetical protein